MIGENGPDECRLFELIINLKPASEPANADEALLNP